MSTLPEKQHAIPALFEQIGINGVESSDKFFINYSNGIMDVQIKRKTGQTETITATVKGNGFRQIAHFDPEQMGLEERNSLIKSMYTRGERQSTLAKRFGLTQAMVSRIINS